MKKTIQTLLLFLFVKTTIAQFPNGQFEIWENKTIDYPAGYPNNSIIENFVDYGCLQKSTDNHGGNYSCKLESKVGDGELTFGYMLNGDFDNGTGGVKLTGKPTAYKFWYKSTNVSPDEAIGLLLFRNDNHDTLITFTIPNQSNWTQFTLNIALSFAPDSMIVGFASSNAFGPESNRRAGNTVFIDDLELVGATVTNWNKDFENWDTKSFQDPVAWRSSNLTVAQFNQIQAERTTDKKSGMYALKLNTLVFDDIESNQISTLSPFSRNSDTLCGFYKFSTAPNKTDSGQIDLLFMKGNSAFNMKTIYLPKVSGYTYFEIPFQLNQTPDTIEIRLQSSQYPLTQDRVGSALFLDDVYFKRGFGLNAKRINTLAARVYPNPAKNVLNIELGSKELTQIKLINIFGQVIKETQTIGNTQLKTSGLRSGTYTLVAESNNAKFSQKVLIHP